jgi:hypothetical protein
MNLFCSNKTLKAVFGSHYTDEKIIEWDNFKFDEVEKGLFSQKKTKSPLLVQKVPGQKFGLSFVVQEKRKKRACKITDGSGFRVSFNQTFILTTFIISYLFINL